MNTGFDPGSGLLRNDLTPQERVVLERVEGALSEGLELYDWWQRMESENLIERVPVVRQLNTPDWNYGFFSEAPLHRGLLPVLGVVQGMFYDQPKAPHSRDRVVAEWYRAQVREYALRYFLRTSWAPLPQFISGSAEEQGSDKPAAHGWAFQQVFYKLRDTGEIGRFPPEDRFKIIDLRQLLDQYDWVILKVRLYSFFLTKTFLGANGPRLEVPMPDDVWVVTHRDFCRDVENPEPGVIGEYGGGWAVIPVPDPNSVLVYGPRHLGTTFELIRFQVRKDGQVWATVAFVSSRPNRLFNVEPMQWSLRLAELASLGILSPVLKPMREILAAVSHLLPSGDPMQTLMNYLDMLTGGVAVRELCISRSQIYREIMVAHFIELFQFILQTIPTWIQIPDWLDEKNLPDWVNGYRPKDAGRPPLSRAMATSSRWSRKIRRAGSVPLDGRLQEPSTGRASVPLVIDAGEAERGEEIP